MKIQYCSDLHLEFFQNKKYLEQHPIEPVGEILLLAGDICHFSEYAYEQAFFDVLSKNFEMVFLIPGNHEFYNGKDISITDQPIQYKIRENVWLYNNHSIKLGNIQFIFTTLWSMISMKNSQPIKEYMADFRYIRYENKIIDIPDYNLLHQRSLQFLQRALKTEREAKKVIVTHHLPSSLCNSAEYQGSLYNEAFCVELTDIIKDSDVSYWIYGHSHRNMPPIELKGSVLLTNQLGYVSMDEHHSFKRDAFFEV